MVRQVTALTLIGLLVMSVVGAGIVGAAGVDTESAHTEAQSDIVDGTTVTTDGGNLSDGTLIVNVTTTDGAVRVIEDQELDGERVRTTIPVSEMNNTFSEGTGAYHFYATNVSALAAATDVQSGERTNLTLQIIDNASVAESSWSTANVTLTVEAAVGYSYYRMDSDEYDDTDESTFTVQRADERLLADAGSAEVRTDNVGINGTDSTLTVELANDTAAGALNASVASADGNWVQSVTIATTQGSIRAFREEPDGADEGMSYAVINQSERTVTIHFGEGFEGRSTVDGVTIGANQGWLDRFATYGFRLWS